MAAIRRVAPETVVEVTQAEPPEALRLVRRGTVDMALAYDFSAAQSPDDRTDAPLDPQLTCHPVVTEDVHLVLPVNHPRAARRVTDLEELRDETWILSAGRIHEQLVQAAVRAGIEPNVLFVDDDYVMMQALVAEGFGIALLPTLALSVHRDPRVVPRTLSGWPRRHLHVVHWPEMGELPVVQILVKYLQECADLG
jgi:DNA-binding transcriptional LysR family regulator